MSIVYGLDLGTGSLAAVIRKENKIIWTKSYILSPEYGSTKDAAAKRRLARTRNAHRAREAWWCEQAQKIGIEPLKKFNKEKNGEYRVDPKSIDDRLKKEFPSKNESTVYSGVLLRILILEGKAHELESWQIFKAIHSAIQKRGYDKDIPWKKAHGEQSEEESQKYLSEFEEFLEKVELSEAKRLSCYFDALMMDLWSEKDGIKKIRMDHLANQAATAPFKGYTPPRSMVEKELFLLLNAIKKDKRYENLDIEYVMFGSAKKAYASYDPELRQKFKLKRGHENDWQGLLGQKIPRFDNRVISKCSLIPRLNAAKKVASGNKNEQNLYYEFDLAWALHQLKVLTEDGVTRSLNLEESKRLFESFKNPENKRLTPSRLKSELKKLKLVFVSGRDEVSKSLSGRSRYSRVAVRQLLSMLLGGLSPKDFRDQLLNTPVSKNSNVLIKDNKDPTKGLTTDDLKWLELIQDCTWENFYLPQVSLVQRHEEIKSQNISQEQLIQSIISENNNPVVRHRLNLLIRTIDEMNSFIKTHCNKSEPDFVALELVRDDFLSAEKKALIRKVQNNNKKQNEKFREKVEELGLTGNGAVKKYMLWKRQEGICLYMGEPLLETSLENYEIDHVVPQSRGGPDSNWNTVLTTRKTNKDLKGDKTPFEWMSSNQDAWKNFVKRVSENSKKKDGISKKLHKILTSDNPLELAERYQNIAETAWIARQAASIIYCKYSWTPPTLGGKKKVITIPGNVTAQVRRKYKLDTLLSDKIGVKNRKDKRHHILDAMVISFIPSWMNDKNKRSFFKLPPEVNRDYFDTFIKKHLLIHVKDKAILEENFYGQKGDIVTRKKNILDFGIRTKNNQNEFSLDNLQKDLKKYLDQSSDVFQEISKIALDISSLSKNEQHEEYLKRCKALRLKNATNPKRIIEKNKLHEEYGPRYKDSFKTKGLLKPKGKHKGFFICNVSKDEKKKKWKAIAIYAWESVESKKKMIKDLGLDISCYVWSGCYVELRNDVKKISSGVYHLKSIKNGVTIIITNPFDIEQKISLGIADCMDIGQMIFYDADGEIHI